MLLLTRLNYPRSSTGLLSHLLLLLALWYGSYSIHAHEGVGNEASSPFKIILDGGSTGSRLHIFEFVEELEEEENSTTVTTRKERATTNSSAKTQCVRRGSSRVNIPLSAFGRLESEKKTQSLNHSEIAEHLMPLFEYATTVIPPEFHQSTKVFYQATAGMRLLEDSEQEAVYDALYQGLMEEPKFVFSLDRKDIATLSGEMEAFYGAVAANFLHGVIDTELRLIANNETQDDDDTAEHPVVGALDMGGSSTQIVYIHDGIDLSMGSAETCSSGQYREITSNNTCEAPESPQLSDEHFFSTSYLSYGVDQFRERLWNTLVAERAAEQSENPDSCASRVISNPCANKGYEVDWQGYILLGTGDTEQCIRYTQRLIPHPELPTDAPAEQSERVVGGVEHPPIRGKFLAMSLYFFSLDSLRVFSNSKELELSWPTPSIQELEDALDGLCSRDWPEDMALQEGAHSFTRAEVLPHRCLETVYMVTLLKDGFGFHPDSRDITFTFLLDGNEVEWTLGMALAMNAEERYEERTERNDHLDLKPIDKQFAVHGVLNPLMFGVTLPPTHCC